jgi:DHA3 family macrolide efflux protein-like MFS transporter
MRDFVILWFGQLISLVGTGLTRFALTIWIWKTMGTATAVTFLAFFLFAPAVLLSPVAGALVDRWNRKKVLILTDLGAGVVTGMVLILYLTGSLQLWHAYVAGLLASVLESFQVPAQMASVVNMVPREQLGRSNGIMSMSQFGSNVLAPTLGGLLLQPIGMKGLMEIDVATFLIAVLLILAIRIPQPPVHQTASRAPGALRKEIAFGFHYIWERVGLLHLLSLFLVINIITAFFLVILNPMVLARTSENSKILGTVLAANGIGGVVGAIALSLWGGPRQKIQGVLGGMALMCLLGVLGTGLGRSALGWAAGAFLTGLFIPIINGCTRVILQERIAPEVQGRVFGVVRMMAQASFPIGMACAGPLADFVFEPAMVPGHSLARMLGGLVGVGPGTGMSLMLVLAGLLGGAAGLAAYLVPTLRTAETRAQEVMMPVVQPD